ncbi:MAG TPA: hypothetical protein VE970_12710 [Pseudolabrys sp.]|nr:hypothetical protein [Pseudolabrys sp.]
MSELPNDEPVASATPAKRWLPPASAWLKELPYVVVLVLTLLGVAYTSVTRRPTIVYWEFLVIVTAVACIWGGWRYAPDRKAKVRLIGSQALHWLAFFVAMNLVLLPSVQNMLNADATGLAILLLLALGTFVAGVHIPAWQVCVLGLVMGLFVPAIAWIEEAALIVLLALVALIGVGALFWWIGDRKLWTQ